MDKYDLYGKMAIPKKNDPQQEVPEIYRLAARRKGVFVNATPGENFGLTVLESAACGLPVIATKKVILQNYSQSTTKYTHSNLSIIVWQRSIEQSRYSMSG